MSNSTNAANPATFRELSSSEMAAVCGGLGFVCRAIDYVLVKPVQYLQRRFADTPQGHANRRLRNFERKINTGR